MFLKSYFILFGLLLLSGEAVSSEAISQECLGGATPQDTKIAMSLVRKKDNAGIAKLIMERKVFFLNKGATVEEKQSIDGLSEMVVQGEIRTLWVDRKATKISWKQLDEIKELITATPAMVEDLSEDRLVDALSRKATDHDRNIILDELFKRNRNWPQDIQDLIRKRQFKIGMTKPQLLASWGSPNDINRSVSVNRVNEQWVYGKVFIYFENGIITSFQD